MLCHSTTSLIENVVVAGTSYDYEISGALKKCALA